MSARPAARPSAIRTTALLATLATALLAASGCGTDHGQANALTACHQYASATGGGLSPAAYTAKLGVAVHWAGKASKQSAQWDTLASSLNTYESASTEPALSSAMQAALLQAGKVIDSSCEIAARGY